MNLHSLANLHKSFEYINRTFILTRHNNLTLIKTEKSIHPDIEKSLKKAIKLAHEHNAEGGAIMLFCENDTCLTITSPGKVNVFRFLGGLDILKNDFIKSNIQ